MVDYTLQASELPWIAEARQHLGLKEIVGPQHSKTIQSWLKELGSSWSADETAWCLDGNIEVLTSDGFIKLSEMNARKPSQVAMLNTDTHEVEFTDTYDVIEKPYSGMVYNYKKHGIICDPDHRFYGCHSSGPKYTLRPAKEQTSYGTAVPCIMAQGKPNDYSDEQLVFLAVFLSDGHITDKTLEGNRQILISVAKQHKIEILDKFSYISKKEEKYDGRITVRRYVFDASCLRKDALAEYKLLSDDFLFSLSAQQAKVFIDAYSKFDGHDKQVSFEVYSADERLATQLCFIATMAGYKATQYSVKQVSPNSKIEYLHTVYVSTTKHHRYIQPIHREEQDFEGKLYCLSVPSQVMIIRTLTGIIMPIGNCGTFVAHCLKTANRRIPRYWMRAKAYTKVGKQLAKPAYGCLVVFTRDGGGHVGFVIGRDAAGNLMVLGGNQSNMVKVSPFSHNRVVGYFWPSTDTSNREEPADYRYNLPLLQSDGRLSTNEE